MKMSSTLLILIKHSLIHCLWVLACIASANTSMTNVAAATHAYSQQPHNRNFYPTSVANLIADYFKNYKHIKQLTLFLCGTRLSLPPSEFSQPTVAGRMSSPYILFEPQIQHAQLKHEEKQEHQRHPSHDANLDLSFQQIVKHLMVLGNFLIKGDGNIDAVDYAATVDAASVPELNTNKIAGRFKLLNMLKCGDFKQGVVLDLRCHQSKFILQQASEYGFFNTSHHWLMLQAPSSSPWWSPQMQKPSLTTSQHFYADDEQFEFFEHLNINMNSEITLAQPQQQSSPETITSNGRQAEWEKYDLYDMWNSGTLYGGKLNVTHMGFYLINAKLLNITFKETTIIRRMNVHGIKIRTMVVVTNNFNESFDRYLDHTYNPHLDSLNRFNYRLLTYVRDMFNFRWIVYRTNSWGYLKNGTFDGMIGALVRKEIDVGGSPIFFRLERAKVIDYTARTWIARPCFVFRHPSGLMRNIFIQPFTNCVWYCVIVSGFLMIVIVSRITYREQKTGQSGAKEKLVANQSLGNSLKRQRCLHQHKGGQSRKLQNNDDTFLMSNRKRRQQQKWQQQQLQAQKQLPEHTNNMLTTTIKRKQQAVLSTSKREIYQRQHNTQKQQQQQQQHQIIPLQKNIIIEICRKLFRKWFFTSVPSSSLSSLPLKQKQRPMPVKKQQTMNYTSNGKINHENLFVKTHRDYACCCDDDDDVVSNRNHDLLTAGGDHHIVYYHNEVSVDGNGTAGKTTNADEIGETDMERAKSVQMDAAGKYDECTFSRCALLFVGAMCQQGSSETPQFISRRFIVIVILLFGFCIFQFYSASVVSSLLMEKPKTIKTLRNLIDSSLRLGIEDIVYNKDFFERTTDTDALDLYNKKVRIVNAKTGDVSFNFFQPAEGMEKVKQGGYAFHADTATSYKIMQDEFTERSICELSEIQLFPEQHMMNIVQKGSPLRKMITYGLRRTFETGLLYHERKKWHSQKPMCVRQIKPEDLEVGFESTFSAYILLLAGILASTFLVIVENIVWHFTKRSQMSRM